MATPLDYFAPSTPAASTDEPTDYFSKSFFNEPSLTQESDAASKESMVRNAETGNRRQQAAAARYRDEQATQAGRVNRMKAEDLASRGIPTYRNASGGVSPVEDDSGTPLTGLNSKTGIAYDSQGQPKQISAGDNGPVLSDPFARLPAVTDPKTGAIEKNGPGGIYQYVGQDPNVTAKVQQAEKDKEIAKTSELVGRKLTLDEHDLKSGQLMQKNLHNSLTADVPTLLDPKYHGAGKDAVLKAVDDHFDSQYAAPEANATSGFFSKDLSPDALALRQSIDQKKAAAYDKVNQIYDLNDRLSQLSANVQSGDATRRAQTETLLAHQQGQVGPLDHAAAQTGIAEATPPRLFPPEEDWARMLGGKDAVAAMHDQIQQGNVPPAVAPAALATTHDIADANAKADALKDSDPTTADKYKNFAASMLHGLNTGVQDVINAMTSETPLPGGNANPINWTPKIAAKIERGVFGKSIGDVLQENAARVSGDSAKLLDDRLKDSIGSKAGNFIGGITPYVLAAVATKGTSVATPLMASMFYTTGYQHTLADAQAHGADPLTAEATATAVGAINAVLALPLGKVGAAAKAVFGDSTPQVVKEAIQGAYEKGGLPSVGTLLSDLSNYIKSKGGISDAGRQEILDGVNNVIKEITKTPAQRMLTVAQTAASHAALGAGVQTSENLIKKTYNPDQQTFEGVGTQALGFGALGALSEGFKQVADARKAKAALDIINPKPPGGETPSIGGPEKPAAPKGGAPALTEGGEPNEPATTPGGIPPEPKTGPTGGAPAPEPSDQGGAKTLEQRPDAPAAKGGESATKPAEPSGSGQPDLLAPKATRLPEPRTMKDSEIESELKGIGYDVHRMPGEEFSLSRGGEPVEGPPKEARAVSLAEELGARHTADQTKSPRPEGAPPAEGGRPATPTIDVPGRAPTPAVNDPRSVQRPITQKGKTNVGGIDLTIQHLAGDVRKPGFQPLKSHYGSIDGVKGADGDNLDVFVKPNTPKNWSGPVYVVNQSKADGTFDEHKVVIGAKTSSEATKEYRQNYPANWKGADTIAQFESPAAFKEWAKTHDLSKPAGSWHPLTPPKEGGLPVTKEGKPADGTGTVAPLPAKDAATAGKPTGAPLEPKTPVKPPEVVTKPPEPAKPVADLTKKRDTALTRKADELTKRADAIKAKSTALVVVRTLIKSGTSKALEQAERKLEQLEEKEQPQPTKPSEQTPPSPPKPTEQPTVTKGGSGLPGARSGDTGQGGLVPAKAVATAEDAKAAFAVAKKLWSQKLADREIEETAVKMPGRGGMAIQVQKGKTLLIVDHNALAQNASQLGDKASQWIADALFEEITHYDDLVVAGPGQFIAFHIKIWNQLSPEAQAGVKSAYRSTDQPWKLAVEYIRMVAQQRVLGRITESAFRDVTQVTPFLTGPQSADFESHLKKMGAITEGGEYAPTTGKQQSSDNGELPSVPPRTDLPQNPPKIRKENGEQTTGGGGAVKRGETPAKPKPSTGQPGELDDKASKALDDAFEGLFVEPTSLGDFANIVQPHGAGVAAGLELGPEAEASVKEDYDVAAKAMIEAARTNNPDFKALFGKQTYLAGKLEGVRRRGPNYDEYMRRQGDLTVGAEPVIEQQSFPVDKLPKLITAAQELIRSGIDTPEKMASVLESKFAGKARPFSQAFWDAVGIVRPDLRGTHDWNLIYAAPKKEDEKKAKPQNAKDLTLAVAEHLGWDKKPLDRRALTELASETGLTTKEVDEAAEFGIVLAARGIVAEGGTTDAVYDKLVDLYHRQPNLTAKTSSSKVAQAYSTPAPLAWVAGVLGEIQNGSVLESTAGNGMLLIRTDPEKQTIYANELNPNRVAALIVQGFKATNEDALTLTPGAKVDKVITNPPFGTVLDDNQASKTFPLWGGETKQIDFALAARALDSMKDDGRAVLILGGKNITDPDERAKAYGGQDFWKQLYERYGVIDHFTVDGDLYKKQGAGWPVDVILIRGRGKSPIQLPNTEAPRIIGSWDELRKELYRSDAERVESGRFDPERARAKIGDAIDKIKGIGGTGGRAGVKDDSQPPERQPERGGSGEPSKRPDQTEQPVTEQPGGTPALPAPTGGGAGGVGPGGSALSDQQRESLEYRVPYVPVSKEKPFGIFVPTGLRDPIREALERLQARVGPLDEFVRTHINFKAGSLAGDQMDAVALALDAILQGTAAVNGDQGGIGKGRVGAALIAYAKDHNIPAIFITKEDKLWAAMIEDLHDIGRDDIVPLITKNGLRFDDYSGKTWKQGSMTEVMEEIGRTAKLPDGHDVLFTSYDQIASDEPKGFKASKAERAQMHARRQPPPDGARMRALKALTPQAIVIADESHLASGDSIRAWRLYPLLYSAHGVYYSSATFAKRPDSMGIYGMTSLSHATQSMGDLVDAMKQGGVPLQGIVTSTMAGDGLYMRRERDFSHAVFRTHVMLETSERDAKLADNYTAGLRTILGISNRMAAAVRSLNKILRNRAQQMRVANAPHLESTNFAATLHNLINQYLYAIKAESLVRRAVEGVQKGFTNKEGETAPHKIVIAVTNTMQAAIEGLHRGKRPLNWNGVLLGYLDKMRELKSGSGQNAQVTTITDEPDPNFKDYDDRELQGMIIDPSEDPENPKVNEAALAELFRRIMAGIFKDAEESIAGLELADMPLSPIDHIRQQLSKVGIGNGEITGRSLGIDEDGEIYETEKMSKAAQLRVLSEFNNNPKIKVVVINASGSTGISMHSSEKFGDTTPRAMLIGQGNPDINEFVQTLYRIDRTGQLHQPYYEIIQTMLPAELRPAAIQARKMASLNANTTSNASNEISAGNRSVDIFNQYGDEVIYNYLRSDPTFTQMLDMPTIMGQDGKLMPIQDVLGLFPEPGKFATKVTGRSAVLFVDEQEAFWEKVTADYLGKIASENELGQNELLVQSLNLKAKTIESKELTPAVTGKLPPSGFDAPSYMEKITAEIGTKPEPAKEVIAMMEALGKESHTIFEDWKTKIIAWKGKELQRLSEKVVSWTPEKAESYQSRWRDQEEEITAAFGLVGNGLHLKTDKGMDGYGAITAVKFDDEHPLTPSKQIFTVYVNTTKHKMQIPASQLTGIARMAVGDFATLYEATAERSNERYMVTGNILAAYLAIRDSSPTAKIVQYTTEDGNTRQGILMPVKFKPGDLAKKSLVENASHLRSLLDAGRSVQNSDGSLTIVKPRDRYMIRVPSSKLMGGAYWRDTQLAALMANGVFEQRGSSMVAYFEPDKIPKIYQRLLDLGTSLFYIESSQPLTMNAEPVEYLSHKDKAFFEDKPKVADFYEDLQVNAKVNPAPEHSFKAEAEAGPVLPLDEARKIVEGWKAEAKRIGKEEDHSNEVILSLFDRTGEWSKPYRDAGYRVVQYDIKTGADLLAFFPIADIMGIREAGFKIKGVLAAPPCTSFSGSGARWWPTQHDAPSKEMVEKKYGGFASEYFDTPLEYARTLVHASELVVEMANPDFYAIENPIGRIRTAADLPKPLLSFDPHHYGDPFTKRTQLWGEFNPHLPTANVAATGGSYAANLRGDDPAQKLARSETFEGFAYAFFMANHGAASSIKNPKLESPNYEGQEFWDSPSASSDLEGVRLEVGKPFKDLYTEDVQPVAKSIGLGAKEAMRLLRAVVNPTADVNMAALDRAMGMLGERNQKAYETDRVLEGWRQGFDKMKRPEQVAFVDNYKLGKSQPTPELQDLANTLAKIDEESWQAAHDAYVALGFKDSEVPLAWLENHFRVLWKVIPGRTPAEKSAWVGRARRPLRGSMGQHKQHTLESMSDGLDMGGVPYSYNPIVMFKLAQADLWKLTTTLKAWKWAKENGFVEFVKGPFPKAPVGMVPLNDSIARVYFPASSGEGLINAGQYFVEEGFGRLLNNYLSRDFIRDVAVGRGLIWLKNATTALELSLSPFHAVFETLDAVGSNIGLGLQKLVNRGILGGNAKAAVDGLLDMVKAIGTPLTHGLGKNSLGQQIRRAAADPATFFASAEGKAMLKDYPRAREMINDLFAGGWKPAELEQDWRTNSVRAFVDAMSDIKAGASDNYIGAGLRAFPAANEFIMRPLFDYYIPNLKVAQFFKEYAEAIEQNERKLKGGVLTRQALARQTWRFVEDRFGEMNYDNLFWNRTFKSAMQLMFRSVTWKLGSVSAFGGAFSGQAREFRDAFKEGRAPELHRNTAWLFGMMLVTAVLGTVIMRSLTGKWPTSLTDLVFPQIDPKDDKIRASLPTYFKDLVHLIHSPATYATSSMSGWIGRVAEMWRNKDYYGVQIRDTDDSIVKQALQVGKFTGQTMLPFSVRGYKNLSDNDVGGLRKALALVGLTPAPRFIGETTAERKASDYWQGQRSEAGIRPDQLERKSEKRHLVAQIEHGEAPEISKALTSGAIKPHDVKSIYERARIGGLANSILHMPLADAEKIFKTATPREKQQLEAIMFNKRANSARADRPQFTGF